MRLAVLCVAGLLFGTAGAGCSSGCSGEDKKKGRHDAGALVVRRAEDIQRERAALAAKRRWLPEGTVFETEGDVRLDRTQRVELPLRDRPTDADEEPAKIRSAMVGDELHIGDALSVGPTGSATVRLADPGVLAVGHDSLLVVSPQSPNEVTLVRGRVHASLDAPGRGRRVLRIATPAAAIAVQGTRIVVGVADDGGVNIFALAGPVLVRTATSATPLDPGSAVEIDASGRAGPPRTAPAPAEAVSSMDGWVQGRRDLAGRGRGVGPVVDRLLALVRTDAEAVQPALKKVTDLREANRTLLRERREAMADARKTGQKAPPPTQASVADAQRDVAHASELLVEQTDAARATLSRVFGRYALAQVLAGTDAAVRARVAEMDAPVEALRKEGFVLFRRPPRRIRPEIMPGAAGVPQPGVTREKVPVSPP